MAGYEFWKIAASAIGVAVCGQSCAEESAPAVVESVPARPLDTGEAGLAPVMTRLLRRAESGEASAQCLLALHYAEGRGVKRDGRVSFDWYWKAAMQGYAPAQLALGRLYADGSGVKRDDAEASRWYRFAADAGEPEAQYLLALAYESGAGVLKNSDDAVYRLREAASSGHAAAMYRLGEYIAGGRTTARFDGESQRLWKSAAEAGHAPAMFSMGRVAAASGDGDGAAHWYAKAGDAGVAEANHALGVMFLNGVGIPADPAAAKRRFELAGDAGHAPSRLEFAMLCAESAPNLRDDNKAAGWVSAAAFAGEMRARYAAAVFTRDGRGGVRRDPAVAATMFEGPAKAGDARARYALACLYESGDTGVPADAAKSERWLALAMSQRYAPALDHRARSELYGLRRRAQTGESQAQYELAARYATGDALLTKDETEALRLWEEAAAGGHALAAMSAGSAYAAGRGAYRDVYRAIHFYRIAARLDHVPALLALANIYIEGGPVNRDAAEASRCLLAAAELGHAQSQSWYGVRCWNAEGVPEDRILGYAWVLLSLEGGLSAQDKPAIQMSAALDRFSADRAKEKADELRRIVKARRTASDAKSKR